MINKNITEDLIRILIKDGLGLDLTDPDLKGTPNRMTRMFEEIFASVGKEPPQVTSFPNTVDYHGIVMADFIDFRSTCIHHFVGFSGFAWVVYIPTDKVVGYSKFARVVRHFARNPQLQEKLTKQVCDFITDKVAPEGCMVYMRAKHGCATDRGIKQNHKAAMTTCITSGSFETDRDLELRGLEMIRNSILLEG